MHFGPVQQFQAFETALAPVHVEGVQKQAGVGMVRLDGHQGGLACPAQRLGRTPNLQLGDNAHLAAQLQKRSISFGDLEQVHARRAVDACRRGGDVLAAELRHEVHLLLELLESLGSFLVVIHRPTREADCAYHAQAQVVDSLLQIGQRSAFLDVAVDVAHPGLDALPARLGGQFDLFVQRQFVSHDGAGVQAVAKGLVVGFRYGLRRHGRRRSHRGRAQANAGAGDHLAS